jgi:hypothetical protein
MSARSNKVSEDRTFCPATSRNGRRCDFAEHPGAVHWSWVEGELQQWQALPEPGEAWHNQVPVEDPLRDAPQALKTTRGPQIVGVFVDEFAQLMEKSRLAAKENEMWQNVQDLLKRGQAREVYNRPLVEATALDGRFAYGLLETCPTSAPAVHETVPESGGVPHRELVHADTIREVTVPGHRGGCDGDCCREGYSEDTSYPECWTWDLVRTGIAEKYRAWKDWAL